jgi:hypothetical protein
MGEQGYTATENAAKQKLSFCSDIPAIGAKAEQEADGDEGQRCRLQHHFLHRPRIGERFKHKDAPCHERRAAHQPDDQATAEQSSGKSQNRREDGASDRDIRAGLERDLHQAACPSGADFCVIARPIASRVVSRARTGVLSRPWFITAMRSASSNTSSRS